MQTPTHTLLALAVLSRGGETKRNWTIVAGSLIPDLAIYVWAPYQSYVNGVSGEEMWRELYFQPAMQNLIAWFNSVPIYAVLALIGLVARGTTWGKLLVAFALAALIHMATDFPVHADDAYRHFWPISDWRFVSPLSYWDFNHHGRWVGLFEILLGFSCVAILWRRFPKRPVHIVLGLCASYYMLVLAATVFLR